MDWILDGIETVLLFLGIKMYSSPTLWYTLYPDRSGSSSWSKHASCHYYHSMPGPVRRVFCAWCIQLPRFASFLLAV